MGPVSKTFGIGPGSEVQRSLVIGGIVSSTFLTLVMLPVLYRWLHCERAVRA